MSNTIWSSITTDIDYVSVRNEYFKTLENSDLERGIITTSAIHKDRNVDLDSTSAALPTIGYGNNLVGKSLAQNTAFFTHAFGAALTPAQIAVLQLLESWRSETPVMINGVSRVLTNQDIINGAAGVIPELSALDSLKLTESQASAMLTAYLDGIPGYEGAECRLNAKLVTFPQANNLPTEDPISLPSSEERLSETVLIRVRCMPTVAPTCWT